MVLVRTLVRTDKTGRLIDATGPAHAVYFGTYELVKDLAGGNVDLGHHPLAAGEFYSEQLSERAEGPY